MKATTDAILSALIICTRLAKICPKYMYPVAELQLRSELMPEPLKRLASFLKENVFGILIWSVFGSLIAAGIWHYAFSPKVLRGGVFTEAGGGFRGVRVNVAGFGEEATVTDYTGSFSLRSHRESDGLVHLHAESADGIAVDQQVRPGETAHITLRTKAAPAPPRLPPPAPKPDPCKELLTKRERIEFWIDKSPQWRPGTWTVDDCAISPPEITTSSLIFYVPGGFHRFHGTVDGGICDFEADVQVNSDQERHYCK